MTENPLVELRDAAAKIRADVAEVPPQPWRLFGGQIVPDCVDTWVISSSGVPAWARYLISWHPGVALAVAGLLEAEADQAEQSGKWLPDALSPGVLAVARAYLRGAS